MSAPNFDVPKDESLDTGFIASDILRPIDLSAKDFSVEWIGAPIPGIVSTVAVELNQTVKKGERLLVMEAMKMQNTVYAPVAGVVKRLLVHPGQHAEARDLLMAIE